MAMIAKLRTQSAAVEHDEVPGRAGTDRRRFSRPLQGFFPSVFSLNALYVLILIVGLALVTEVVVGFRLVDSKAAASAAIGQKTFAEAGALRTHDQRYTTLIRSYAVTANPELLARAGEAESDARLSVASIQKRIPPAQQAAWDGYVNALLRVFASGERFANRVRAGATGRDLQASAEPFEQAAMDLQSTWDGLHLGLDRLSAGNPSALIGELETTAREAAGLGGILLALVVLHAAGSQVRARRASRALGMALQRFASGDIGVPPELVLSPEFEEVSRVVGSMQQALEHSRRESVTQGLKQEALQRQLTLYAKDLHDALQRERDMVAQLRDLDRMKSVFVSTVTHELKNPIAAIHGYAKILLDHGQRLDEAQHHEFIRIISQEAENLFALVDDVLMTTQLDSQSLTYRFQPADLGVLLSSIVEEVRLLRPECEIRLDGARDVEVLWVDPTRVRQVFVNLLDNAVKYSPSGGNVHVALERDSEARVVRVLVSDDGIGIAEEDVPKLFQKFGRIHSDATSGIPGTGLGLFIAKQIVEAHAGRISVSSALGKGTTVTVELPMDRPGAESRAPSPES